METPKPVREFVNVAQCFGELVVMYAREKYRAFTDMVDDAMDIDFGDLED